MTTAFGVDSANDVDEAVSTLLAPLDENHVLAHHRDEQAGQYYWTNPYGTWD